MAEPAAVPGPVLFARYAFPPNSHGFCGPADSGSFFEYGVAGVDDGGLRALAQQFAGAWPYLQLIAAATGLDDPLDRRVVEAYWVGSPRLDRVGTRAVGDSMEDRFRAMTGARFAQPHRGRARRGSAAPQLRRLLHLPLHRPADRRPQGRLTPSPCSTGAGSAGAGCSRCRATRSSSAARR